MNDIVTFGDTACGNACPGYPEQGELSRFEVLAIKSCDIRKPALPLPYQSTAEDLLRLVCAWREMPEDSHTNEQATTLRQTANELITQVRAYLTRQPYKLGMEIVHFNGIPAHDEDGLLPPGVYHAQWDEFAARFGFNDHRRRKLPGLLAALHLVKKAGGRTCAVGGSFVTAKEKPGDIDVKFEDAELDPALLEPMLVYDSRKFNPWRQLRRAYFGLDLFDRPDYRSLVDIPISFPEEFGTFYERAVGFVQLDLTEALPASDTFVPFTMFPRSARVYEIERQVLAQLRCRLPEHWAHITDEMLESHGVRITTWE
jgi:hypothetical protein